MEFKVIQIGMSALARFLYSGIQQRIETVRIARISCALRTSGCSLRSPLFSESATRCLLNTQQEDGGWTDVEETAWCLGYLKAFGERYQQEIARGVKWLTSMRLPCGAWGKSERDQPRIPVTALVISLVPEVDSPSELRWLTEQWMADLDSSTQLTYKGAFFLLSQACSQLPTNNDLIQRTVSYLIEQQEENGGFGPWKGHPVGSDPWSTGAALWGLSATGEQAPRSTVEKAISWLESRQLPNGLWPYHYIDDGTAMALIGISSALPLLSEK